MSPAGLLLITLGIVCEIVAIRHASRRGEDVNVVWLAPGIFFIAAGLAVNVASG